MACQISSAAVKNTILMCAEWTAGVRSDVIAHFTHAPYIFSQIIMHEYVHVDW